MRKQRSRFLPAMTLAASLLAIGAVASPQSVFAAEDPIPHIDVVVEKVPPGNAIGRLQTDRNGYFGFKSLAAGTYVVRDKHGNKASVRHAGGQAKWRLIGSMQNRKPTWTLVDESDPL